MKVIKSNKKANSISAKPFSQKHNFFSKEKETKHPFFTPTTIQDKSQTSSKENSIQSTVNVKSNPTQFNQINKSTGKDANNKAKALRKQHDDLKLQTDVVKVAMKEIKRGKSIGFNKDTIIKKHLPKISGLLGIDFTSLKSEWIWLVGNISKKDFAIKEALFFSKITKSDISTIKNSYSKSHAHDWIKNTYEEVFNLIIKHSDSDITPAQLFAYTSNEGLALLTKAGQDARLSGADFTALSVSGFGSLGLDDFMTDITAKRKPLTDFLPTGFKSTITEDVNTNEKGRSVKSAIFPNLDSALQGAMAMLKRRRALFLEDANNKGYTKPTIDEKVYWTYTYFNPGEFGGKAQLEKYKKGNSKKIKERKLSDWISKGEYPHSQRVLQGYLAIKKMKLFT